MSKKTSIWLIVAGILILTGCGIFSGVMSILQWDFSKLSTVQYETNQHEIKEEFQDISIITHTANVVIEPSEDGKTHVICREQKKLNHAVEIKDGVLTVEIKDTRKWYECIAIFSFSPTKITLYLPRESYEKIHVQNSTGDVTIPDDFKFQSLSISSHTGDVSCSASVWDVMNIENTTGEVRLEGLTAGSLRITTTTGDITAKNITCENSVSVEVTTGNANLSDLTCKSLSVQGDTGDANLKKVLVNGKITVKQDTGDVNFDKCDAEELWIETDTGDVSGSFMTPKIFYAQTDTGSVTVPHTTTGGKCEIHTDTGDIEMEILIKE